MPNEVELKLCLAPAQVIRLQRHPFLAAHTSKKLPAQRLVSIYYDTPDLTLHKNKIALRLRQVGNRWIQTIKTEGSVAAGLHQRPEWEQDTQENTLDFQQLSDPELQAFFADDELRRALRPIFTTTFTRTRRLLEWPSGEAAEFALDQGEVRADDQAQPLCEVELELKSGDPARLFELALALQETLPLQLANISKAERGYRLATHARLAPVKARAPELATDTTVSEAFLRIAQGGIAHVQANEEGVLQEDDAEFVHQMRVAARRLRSALSTFSDIISAERVHPIREELRWLTRELDGARNWDVFTLQTLPPIRAAFPEHIGLDWLAAQGEILRRRQNTQAREAVASPRYQRFLLTFGAWLMTGAWRETGLTVIAGDSEPTAVDFAAWILQKRHARLKKRGAHLATLTPRERHAVRIAAKKLRYAAEFFSSLFPRKRTHRYIAALARLQDILGAMNDAATTLTLMQDIDPTPGDAMQQHAKGIVLGWAAGGSHAQLAALERVWADFLERKRFWS